MADQWYVARNNKKHGPFTAAKLKELATQGRLLPTDMLLKEGTQQWVPASTVGGLFSEQPTSQAVKEQGARASTGTVQSSPGNPVAWIQEQFRTNPHRALLVGGSAALGLVFFLCLGCMGVVNLISGGNQRSSSTEKFGVEPASHDSGSPNVSEYKKLIVGKWKYAGDDLGALGDVIDQYTADGRIIVWDAKDNGVAGRGKYQFVTPNTVKFMLDGEPAYTATIRIEGDEMTVTDEDGKSSTVRRVK